MDHGQECSMSVRTPEREYVGKMRIEFPRRATPELCPLELGISPDYTVVTGVLRRTPRVLKCTFERRR